MDTHGRVGLYLRLSQDAKKGTDAEGASIKRQRGDCKKLIAERGWTLVDEYADNDRSATSGAVREQWERLLDDVRTGQIDRIVAWARDRLTRDTVDAGMLEREAKARGVMVTIYPGTDFDLSDPTQLLNFQILGSVGGFEVGIKNARAKARYEQDRAAGLLFLRRRPFGYLPNPDKVGRVRENPWDCTVLEPDEARAVRWLYEQVLAGDDSPRRLARVMDRAGITTVAGQAWTTSGILGVLRNPLYGGIQSKVHKDGGRRTRELMPDIATHWTPIVSREQWYQVQALLDAKTAQHHNGQRRVRASWLSNLLRCEDCRVRMGQNRDMMICRATDHGLGIRADLAGGVVERFVIGQIATMGERLGLVDPNREQARGISDRIAEIQTDLLAAEGIKRVSERVKVINALTDEQDALHAEYARLNAARSIESVVGDLVSWVGGLTGADATLDDAMGALSENVGRVREAWAELTMEQQHKIADAMGVYVVRRARPGLWGAQRVEVYPRDPRTGEISPHAIDEDPEGYSVGTPTRAH